MNKLYTCNESSSFDFLRWLTHRNTTNTITPNTSTKTTTTATMAPITGPDRELLEGLRRPPPPPVSLWLVMSRGSLQLLTKKLFLERIWKCRVSSTWIKEYRKIFSDHCPHLQKDLVLFKTNNTIQCRTGTALLYNVIPEGGTLCIQSHTSYVIMPCSEPTTVIVKGSSLLSLTGWSPKYTS